MAKPRLPADLREFLKLLNSARVEYLLVGGYAVGYYDYPRTTADLDIWVAVSDENAHKLVDVLKAFGFDLPSLKPELFLVRDRIVRFGEPPLRIEILTAISGVSFGDCFSRRTRARWDGLRVNLIGLNGAKADIHFLVEKWPFKPDTRTRSGGRLHCLRPCPWSARARSRRPGGRITGASQPTSGWASGFAY
jgi:hypothetical protein